MFGFSKNPDRSTMNEIYRITDPPVRYMTYIYMEQALPPKDGMTPISLTNEENIKKIINCFNEIIDLNFLENSSDISSTLMELKSEANRSNPEQLYFDTLGFMCDINAINNICTMYYVYFPKSKKMLEIVNDLAKLFPPAFILIFGESMPDNYRKIWPYLSNIFEHYRTHAGI